MSSRSARILLVADTHLGFDLPFRPRVQRRRRGHDFFANLEIALAPALDGQVDLVVHGGDLYYRSRVPPALVEMAMAPLLEVARSGIPVYIVPGNHERSRIPLNLWTTHPNLHIYDRPRTFHWRGPGGSDFDHGGAAGQFDRFVLAETEGAIRGADLDMARDPVDGLLARELARVAVGETASLRLAVNRSAEVSAARELLAEARTPEALLALAEERPVPTGLEGEGR